MSASESPITTATGTFSSVPSKVKWLIYLMTPSAIGYGYLIVFVSAYLVEFGLGSDEVGMILGVNGAAFVCTAIPFGILADRRGRKNLFLFGLAGAVPPLFVFAFTAEFSYLLIAAVVMGVAEGALLTTWNALIADLTPKASREAAFSLSFIVSTVAFGIGFALPVAFPAIEAWVHWDSHTIHSGTFFVAGIFATVSPLALRHLLKDYHEELHPSKKWFVRGPNLTRLLKFSGFNSIVGLGAGFIIPLIPTWLFLKFGVSDTYSGPLLAVASVTMGFAAIISPRLAARHGVIKAIVLTQMLSTVFMLSLAFIPNAAVAAAAYLIRAALMNMASPLLDAFLMGIVTKEERGFASALNTLIWRLPNSVTTIIGGYILAAGMYDVPFFLATAFYVTGIGLLYHVFKNVQPES